jgi:hypothetical protein
MRDPVWAMTPEHDTEQLRAVFSERAKREAAEADDSAEAEAERTHSRRAEKANYLEEKLAEKAKSEAEADGE